MAGTGTRTSAHRVAPRGGSIVLALVCACALAAVTLKAGEIEAQVKAAFIPKLANFVEWPANAFTNAQAPFVIAIIGDDPFGAEFERALAQQQVHSRKVSLVRLKQWSPTNACHLLFLGRNAVPNTSELLAELEGRPILTLGDESGFAESGGVMNFRKVDGRVRFEVNVDAATRQGLKISSRLLQVSRIVDGGPRSAREVK